MSDILAGVLLVIVLIILHDTYSSKDKSYHWSLDGVAHTLRLGE